MEANASAEDSSDALHCGRGALTGPLGLFVQALLAFIAFSALIVKRFCEPRHERRPWTIWFFDTSKQAIGAAVIHFANVFLSEIFHGDPCTWYVISFLLDSTIGLLIICLCLKISLIVIKRKGWNSLIFGHYGYPARCKAWMGQCAVYVVVIVFEKILMTLLVLFDFWKEVRKLILSPIKDPKLELVIVMFIIPFIVNALIFWVVDNFLKEKPSALPPWKAAHGNSSMQRTTGNVLVDEDDEEAGPVRQVRMSPFRKSGYNRVKSANDSDSDRLLSFDDDPGFDVGSLLRTGH